MIIQFGMIDLIAIVFLAVNALTLVLYIADKRKAVSNKWRIGEKTLITLTLAFGGFGALLGMCVAMHKTKSRKFKVAVAAGLIIALIPVIHIAHSLTLDRVIRYVEVEFRSENWPAGLNGYRIAFMIDMHTISDEVMREVAAELNTRSLDLLLLGGDYSMRDGHYLGTLREIAQIRIVDGIFGVDGNHDDHTRLYSAMELYGMTPLDNSGIHIRDGFYLAGIRDLWSRNPDIYVAVEGANEDDFVLLISHNPDVAMMLSTSGIDFVVSGHTHSGQITLFGYAFYLLRGSITDYGTRFAYGFAQSADGIPVFVSSGVGPYYFVPRMFARPEVVIFTMLSE